MEDKKSLVQEMTEIFINNDENLKEMTDTELGEAVVSYGSKEEYQRVMESVERAISGKLGKRKNDYIYSTYDGGKLKSGQIVRRNGEIQRLKRINLIGKEIRSASDAANLFSLFRDSRVEIFNILMTDNEGKVVYHGAWTMGLISGVKASPKGYDAYFKYLEEIMERTGAVDIMIAHNHPSGNIEASFEDRSLTQEYAKFLGEKFFGQIVVDTDRYSVIYRDGKVEERKITREITEREREDDDLLKRTVRLNNAEVVAKTFKSVMARGGNAAVLAIINRDLRVMSWTYIKKGGWDSIQKYMKVAGGGNGLIITNNVWDFENYKEKFFNRIKDKDMEGILDVIKVDKRSGDMVMSLKQHELELKSREGFVKENYKQYVEGRKEKMGFKVIAGRSVLGR